MENVGDGARGKIERIILDVSHLRCLLETTVKLLDKQLYKLEELGDKVCKTWKILFSAMDQNNLIQALLHSHSLTQASKDLTIL